MDLWKTSSNHENSYKTSENQSFSQAENQNADLFYIMSMRIRELENQILNQNQLNQRRELELHKQFDQKKCKWFLKYLEIKLQNENVKSWQEKYRNDFPFLQKTINSLFTKLKDRDIFYFDALKNIESDLKLALKAGPVSPDTSREGYRPIPLSYFIDDGRQKPASPQLKQQMPTYSSMMENVFRKITHTLALITQNSMDLQKEFEGNIQNTLEQIQAYLQGGSHESSFHATQTENGNLQSRSLNRKSKLIKDKMNVSKLYTILENNIISNHEAEKSLHKVEDSQSEKMRILEQLQSSFARTNQKEMIEILQQNKDKINDIKEFLNDNSSNLQLSLPEFPSKSILSSVSQVSILQNNLRQQQNTSQISSEYNQAFQLNNIIQNNLSHQRAKSSQKSISCSNDILDQRKYLNSFYNQEYFRKESDCKSEVTVFAASSKHPHEDLEPLSITQRILRKNTDVNNMYSSYVEESNCLANPHSFDEKSISQKPSLVDLKEDKNPYHSTGGPDNILMNETKEATASIASQEFQGGGSLVGRFEQIEASNKLKQSQFNCLKPCWSKSKK